MPRYCVFCQIVEGNEPADVLLDTEDVIVFRNRLRWVPVMLLAVPKKHMTQSEMWADAEAIAAVGAAATKVGNEHCPGGYRFVSNFGYDGMQSQDHAHIHILGGMFLGEYA